jgi:hypothetical protein
MIWGRVRSKMMMHISAPIGFIISPGLMAPTITQNGNRNNP